MFAVGTDAPLSSTQCRYMWIWNWSCPIKPLFKLKAMDNVWAQPPLCTVQRFNRKAMRLPMLMASLSKCHLCRQYRYSAGKQPINVFMGGELAISLNWKWWRFVGVFSTQSLYGVYGQWQTKMSSERIKKRNSGGDQVCHWGHKPALFIRR